MQLLVKASLRGVIKRHYFHQGSNYGQDFGSDYAFGGVHSYYRLGLTDKFVPDFFIGDFPGKYPVAGVGPMSLLKQTRLNHMGKLAFKWMYWNMLLPGHDIPGIPTRMSMTGKDAAMAGA